MNMNKTDATDKQIRTIADITTTLTEIQQTLDDINNSPAPISSTSYRNETDALRLTAYKLNDIAHNIDNIINR